MYARSVVLKLIIFVCAFSAIFWIVRMNNVLPLSTLSQDIKSIPTLFGVGNFLFSIISGFVIQSQWSKWDTLIDANYGEINMLRQLFVVAHHFPVKDRNLIRYHIYRYLDTYVTVSTTAKAKYLHFRSKKVDEALARIEDTLFSISKKYPDMGTFAFTYLTRAMEYREIKLQSGSHRLPIPIRVFLFFATGSVIIGSLFMPFANLMLNYYFTLVVASLAFGIILIVDDFDHPYRPGIYFLSVDAFKNLRNEIYTKLKDYKFDFKKAKAQDLIKSQK